MRRRALALPLVLATALAAAPAAAAVPAAPPAPPAPAATDGVRVLVTTGAGDVGDVARRAEDATGGEVVHTYTAALRGFAAEVPAAELAGLAEVPGVVRVERDPRLTAAAVQPAPPVGLDRIDQRTRPLSGSYTSTRTGAGVTAYVVDTGIRLTHSDLAGRARSGVDVIEPGTPADDCNGHGTHVAGTVGGTRSGVAKGTSLVAVRVLDCDGGGFGSDLLAGLDFVVRDHDAGEPAVAVLSLGGDVASRTVDDAVRRVIGDGVPVAVAAGNSAIDACTVSPARVAEALTVGASDPRSDLRAPFSNVGACLDLFAPGVDTVSASHTSDTGFHSSSGTSMAAPHVAGAAALVLEQTPGASPQEVSEALLAEATKGVVGDARSTTSDLLYVDPQEAGQAIVASPSPTASASPTASPDPSPSAAVPNGPEDLTGLYTPVRPARLLDTRTGPGRLPPGEPVTLQVTGRGGVPPVGVTAVALNVTAVGALGAGHLTAYPAGQDRPEASNVNFRRGQTVANAVVTGVSSTGEVELVANGGSPHVVVDVVGYFADGRGSRFTALRPDRLLDTRGDTGGLPGRLPAGAPVALQVTGRGGVPSTGVTAVALNVTAVAPDRAGHLTVFPAGGEAPTASSLNYGARETVPNLVLVGVGDAGRVALQANTGSPHVVVDVVGFWSEGSGARLVPVTPQRLVDTRSGAGRLPAGRPVTVDVGGRAGVPGVGVDAVVLNVTAVSPLGAGHLTVFPPATTAPLASNVNYVRGQTVPNLVVVGVGADDRVEVLLQANAGDPHVVVDVVGYLRD